MMQKDKSKSVYFDREIYSLCRDDLPPEQADFQKIASSLADREVVSVREIKRYRD